MYCKNCHLEVMSEAIECPKCGYKFNQDEDIKINIDKKKKETKFFVAHIMCIFSCISTLIIGVLFNYFLLILCIVQVILIGNYYKKRGKISVEQKIVMLLFVSTIGGIIMLCDH
ncbi:MAG: hypothetical protein SOU07_00855 [Bacilli bacterium]|nr:hypothetical protein [Acholeplasmataceae bacterium]MDY2901978.1 hypothetical protein [Bacilli bacterium]